MYSLLNNQRTYDEVERSVPVVARVELFSGGGEVAGVVDGEEVARHHAAGAGDGGEQRLYLAPPSLGIKPTTATLNRTWSPSGRLTSVGGRGAV